MEVVGFLRPYGFCSWSFVLCFGPGELMGSIYYSLPSRLANPLDRRTRGLSGFYERETEANETTEVRSHCEELDGDRRSLRYYLCQRRRLMEFFVLIEGVIPKSIQRSIVDLGHRSAADDWKPGLGPWKVTTCYSSASLASGPRDLHQISQH